MGLLNKLKNALFEEEEIELPVNEPKQKEVKEQPTIKEDIPERKPSIDKIEKIEKAERASTAPKKEIEDILDETRNNELFKAENTFKFPEFDEEEFATNYRPPVEKEEKKEPTITPKERFERVKPITYEGDKKPKSRREEPKKVEPKVEDTSKHTFKPSPVISPVYGVLDKNYKKEDIITVKEEKPKKKYDVDEIRKKAFGTLEEDIEKTFEQPQNAFYNRSSKDIDSLLNDSADEVVSLNYDTREKPKKRVSRDYEEYIDPEEETEDIPIKTSTSRAERRTPTRNAKYNDVDTEIEENIEEDNETFQEIEEPPKKTEEKRFEEDTLENDLFDLIDSMYDSREEDDDE